MNKIEKSKAQLLLEKPFYGYQLLSLPLMQDNKVETASTNGKIIKYNNDYINSLSLNQVKTLLVHETKHVMYLHHFRIKTRDKEIFNIACDYAINYELIYQEGFTNIPGILLDTKYTNMSAEQIYDILYKNPNQNKSSNNTQIGDIEAAPPEMRESEEKEKIKEIVQEAVKYADKAGKMSGNLKKQVLKYLKPKIKWENLLLNWFNEKNTDDYNWCNRDNRILDYFFPSLEDESLGLIGIAIDVSGSINQNMYNQFISEINNIRKSYQFDCMLLACNTVITMEKQVSKYDKIEFNIKGGGGTCFKPVFDRFKNENLAGIIYFTDMQSSDLYNLLKPNCDVLWANFGRRYIKPPFGSVINITV